MGNAFGIEHSLGTDPLLSDRNNPRNLQPPFFNAQHQALISFGRNTSAASGTLWTLYRSPDLAIWTEIYRFDGTTQSFDPNLFSVTVGANSFTLIDKAPPQPKAFYQFRAVLP